jgi:hypothetical protein
VWPQGSVNSGLGWWFWFSLRDVTRAGRDVSGRSLRKPPMVTNITADYWVPPQRMSLIHPPGCIVGRHVSRSLLRGESALPLTGERRRCRNVTGNLHDKRLGHRVAPAGGLGRPRGDGLPVDGHQSLGFPSATPSPSGGGGWGRRVPNHDPVGQIPRPTCTQPPCHGSGRANGGHSGRPLRHAGASSLAATNPSAPCRPRVTRGEAGDEQGRGMQSGKSRSRPQRINDRPIS